MPIEEATNGLGLAVLALLGTGGLASVIALIRNQVKAASSASVGIAHDNADKGMVSTLREEIGRLESLIARMQTRIDALEQKQQRTVQDFVEVQQGLLDVERELLGCDCEAARQPRVKLQEAQDLLRQAVIEHSRPVVMPEDKKEVK